ncbi:MAG: hypothetical protein AAGI17_01580 [Planctomycetota bacterium]
MRVTDDSGARVRCPAEVSWPAHLPKPLRKRLIAARPSPATYLRGFVITALATLVLQFGIVFLLNALPGVGGVPFFPLHTFIGAIVLGMLVMGIVWIVRAAQGQKSMIEAARLGTCGVCAYSLADLPIDADGLVTCPECTARWRLPAKDDQ